jgi:hypothetical protein
VVSKTSLALQRARDLALRWLAPRQTHAQWNEWNLYREIAWCAIRREQHVHKRVCPSTRSLQLAHGFAHFAAGPCERHLSDPRRTFG